MTVDETVRRRMAPFVLLSIPRSELSKGYWRTNAPPAAQPNPSPLVAGAEEYLLERKLFRRRSTGKSSIPPGCNSHFRPDGITTRCVVSTISGPLGGPPDPRMNEAIDLLRSKRQPDATWLLENTHPGALRARRGRWSAQPVEYAAGPSLERPMILPCRIHSPKRTGSSRNQRRWARLIPRRWQTDGSSGTTRLRPRNYWRSPRLTALVQTQGPGFFGFLTAGFATDVVAAVNL